ncbi:MAG: hypothetical protein IPM18_11590 [Phycisphaerales bacterium]|nr:hypothetical protein [Phycisphaerales bacterium]
MSRLRIRVCAATLGGGLLLVLVLGGCPGPGETAMTAANNEGSSNDSSAVGGVGNADGGNAGNSGGAGGAGTDNAGDAGNSGSAGAGGAGGGPTGALVGVWRAQFVDPLFGPGQVELVLMANGTFSQQTIYQAGSLVTIFGTFRVFPTEALLRLDIQRGEPAETCGPLGCTPILYPAGESYGFTLLNNGQLVLQNINCNPAAGLVCVFNFVRVV